MRPDVSPVSPAVFAKRFLTALVVVSVISALTLAFAYQQAESKVSHLRTANIDPKLLEAGGNFLLIGSDSRAFVDTAQQAQEFGSKQTQTGQRSDTIMVAHVDAKSGHAYLVSFPRDLWVAIPGLGHAKINAAFNYGPQRVIETIENDFSIPISHYLEVDFAGFQNIVNAIGKIPIYFPTPARDVKTGLLVNQAGCQHLDGTQALAYVRSRYYQSLQNGEWRYDPTSDLGRIKRQQYFLRTLAHQAVDKMVHSPLEINSLADKLTSNLTKDKELDWAALRALAYAFHQKGGIETVTLPTHPFVIDGQDALALDEAAARPILDRLLGVTPATAASAGATKPSSVRVEVLNGSGTAGRGAHVAAALKSYGFGVPATASNADRSDYTLTEARYAPGSEAKAALVLSTLRGVGRTVALTNGAPSGIDVVLVIGRDYTGVSAPTTQPPATAAPHATTAANSVTGTTLPAAGC